MDYEQKKAAELHHYAHVESLNPESLPDSLAYWGEKWAHIERAAGFGDGNMYADPILTRCVQNASRTVRAISFGTGTCDNEIAIAQSLLQQGHQNFHIDCLEFNPELVDIVRTNLAQLGLTPYITVVCQDINQWVASGQYDVVIAAWCLHHFVELEHIFDQVHRCLTDDGVFVTAEAIGRNGHVRWPEVWPILQPLWNNLPDKYKFNHQLGTWDIDKPWDDDCAAGSFEGVRAQDILPLLMERFSFHQFAPEACLAEKFFEKNYGPNYDIANDEDRAIIDEVADLDERLIDLGIVKPCRMYAVMGKRPIAKPKYYKHWTPEFAVRWPDGRPSITPYEAKQAVTQAKARISVVMLSQNQQRDTLLAIDSLLKSNLQPVEIIVVDNGSHDGVSTTLTQLGGVIKCQRVESPIAPIDAWQVGIARASGELLALVGNDVRVQKGWDAPLVAAVGAQRNIAASPTVVDSMGKSHQSAGIDNTTGVCLFMNVEALRSDAISSVEVIESSTVRAS